MSSNQTGDSPPSRFTAIFEAASNRYKTLTGQDLGTHPVALALDGYNSPDSILEVFRKQAQAFDKFRNGDDKLITLLTPIITILFTFSSTLGEGISLVSFHFSCISAMLSQLFNVQCVSHSLPQRQYLLESGSFSG
jgi:hypothetical protein